MEKSSLTACSEGPLGRVKSVGTAPEGGVVARRHGLRLAPPLEARQVLHRDRLKIQGSESKKAHVADKARCISTVGVADSGVFGPVA